jgi:predicted ester cyclase
MRVLTEQDRRKPTRKEILAGMTWLVRDVKAGDVLYFHYSGHGAQLRDKTGDEKDGKDESIVPLDYQRAGQIIDDELEELLVRKVPPGATLYCVFDCCHSGTILDMRYCFNEKKYALTTEPLVKETKGDVYLITGCQNVQTSADLPPGYKKGLTQSVGALTTTLLPFIEQKLPWGKLVTSVRRGLRASRLKQIPQFETGRSIDVNSCAFAKIWKGAAMPSASNGAPPSDAVEAETARKRREIQRFFATLNNKPAVKAATEEVRAAFLHDRKYRDISKDYDLLYANSGNRSLMELAEDIYVRVGHLFQYIVHDPVVLRPILKHTVALMNDPDYSKKLAQLRVKYPTISQQFGPYLRQYMSSLGMTVPAQHSGSVPPSATRPPVQQGATRPKQQEPQRPPQPSAPVSRGITKALLIGINYIGSSAALSGCINDVKNVHRTLTSMGFNSQEGKNTRTLTEEVRRKPTRQNILNSMQWLTEGAQPGDVLWFHYSGHGAQIPDKSHDEQDGKDESLVPLDYQRAGMITDDDLEAALVKPLPAGVTLYCVFDCCHSGTILDLRYTFNERKYSFAVNKHEPITAADVFLITGCQNVQTSADLPPGYIKGLNQSVGALTGSLMPLLKRNLNWCELITTTRKGLRKSHLQQIPQFECGREIDLKGYAFAKAFPTRIPQTQDPNAPSRPQEAIPAAAGSVKADVNHHEAKLVDQLRTHPGVAEGYYNLMAALKRDRKYKKVYQDMRRAIAGAADVAVVRERVYVRMMHLMPYIANDPAVLRATEQFRDAIVRDPVFFAELQVLRKKYPQFQQALEAAHNHKQSGHHHSGHQGHHHHYGHQGHHHHSGHQGHHHSYGNSYKSPYGQHSYRY